MSTLTRLHDFETDRDATPPVVISATKVDAELDQIVTESNAQDVRLDAIEANGFVTTVRILDDAVTAPKISFIDDSLAVTDTHIMVADGTDYNNVAMSGDATMTNAGVVTVSEASGTLSILNVDNLRLDGNTVSSTSGDLQLKAVSGSNLTLQDDADASKEVTLVMSGVTTSTDRAWTFPDASDTFTGIAATQTLTNKTLTSPVIANIAGGTVFNDISADVNFRVETDDVSYMFEIDGGLNAISIGGNGSSAEAANPVLVNHTTRTVAANADSAHFKVASSNGAMAGASSGTHGMLASVELIEPNITKNAGAITNSATLHIKSAPSEATNNYAIKVSSGAVDFAGTLDVTGTITGNVTGNLTGDVTGDVTGNTSGTAATVTTAAQPAITSVGTMTILNVDNLRLDANTVSSTTGDLQLKAVSGSNLTLQDDADATKEVTLVMSGVTTGTERTWTFVDASDTFVGIAATQTLTNKTLTSPVIANIAGGTVFNDISADVNFRVETDDVAHMFEIDGGLNAVAFGGVGSSAEAANPVIVNHTTRTVATNADSAHFKIASSNGAMTGAGSGTHAMFASCEMIEPNITKNAGAITEAATLHIKSAPSEASTNYAIKVASGAVNFGGTLDVTGAITGNLTGNASGTAATVTGATQASITTCANLTTSGALNAGSITSGFGNIDNGSSTISGGALTATTIAGTGDATITSGNIVIATNGKGIDFSAQTTDGAGVTAEILDDYEYGTWTPALSGGTPTYTANNEGSYVKVGESVFVRGVLEVNALNSANANLFTGLPFTAKTTASANMAGGLMTGYSASLAVTPVSLTFDIDSAATTGKCRGRTGASATTTNLGIWQNSARVDFCGWYQIA